MVHSEYLQTYKSHQPSGWSSSEWRTSTLQHCTPQPSLLAPSSQDPERASSKLVRPPKKGLSCDLVFATKLLLLLLLQACFRTPFGLIFASLFYPFCILLNRFFMLPFEFVFCVSFLFYSCSTSKVKISFRISSKIQQQCNVANNVFFALLLKLLLVGFVTSQSLIFCYFSNACFCTPPFIDFGCRLEPPLLLLAQFGSGLGSNNEYLR